MPGTALRNPADHGRMFPAGSLVQRVQHGVRLTGGNNRQHPSFAGAVERVQPQEVTGGGYRWIDGDRIFLQFDGQGAAFDKFVERGGHAAAGGVAQGTHTAGLQRRGAELVQRAAVGEKFARKGDFSPCHQDGRTVAADAPADQHRIPGTDGFAGQPRCPL